MTLGPLTRRVRVRAFETSDSYAERLREENGISTTTWNHLLFGGSPPRNAAGRKRALETAVEAVGGLRAGHFAETRMEAAITHSGVECGDCKKHLGGRHLCRLCAAGVGIAQVNHDGPRVCHRHQLWIGPEARPEEQCTVSSEVRVADTIYQRMRVRGLITPTHLAELEDCVRSWVSAEEDLPLSAPHVFSLAVEIGKVLTQDIQVEPGDERAKHERLSKQLACLVGKDCLTRVDRVWMLLRPSSGQDHAFGMLRPHLSDTSSHLQALRTCAYPRKVHLHLTQFVGVVEGGTRGMAIRFEAKPCAYLCELGHSFEASVRRLGASGKTGGCPYCAGKKAIAGFNSIIETDPEIAAQFHPTANGALKASQLRRGARVEVIWICEQGHSYTQSPNRRTTDGVGCGVCTNRSVDSRYNSVSRVHPEFVGEWNVAENGGLTPDGVGARSGRQIEWVCAECGNRFAMSPRRRDDGGGCPSPHPR